MLHIPFTDLEQLGEFIIALLEKEIDITPSFVNIVLHLHKAVIEDNPVKSKDGTDAEQYPEDYQSCHFYLLLVARCGQKMEKLQ
jgi:hypothetical protein